ncbi:flagellar protein FlgN [Desulfobulbus propionicus]|jgi:flagellar biosynthesis/type III secretory pathway chaperone
MERETVRNLLIQLRETIKAEREHAKALDLPAMMADVRRKETLIQLLNSVSELHPEDQQYAREIQHENRRNAFLFRATLNWIQETMEFFGRKSVPVTYSPYGQSRTTAINGRLLSGIV